MNAYGSGRKQCRVEAWSGMCKEEAVVIRGEVHVVFDDGRWTRVDEDAVVVGGASCGRKGRLEEPMV